MSLIGAAFLSKRSLKGTSSACYDFVKNLTSMEQDVESS